MDDEIQMLKPWSIPGLRATSLRARRRAWIQRFEAEQRQRRQYCKLAWAVDEMARRLTPNGETLLDRDPQRLKRSLRDIQHAISEGAFGDQLLNICEYERLRRLTVDEARAIGSMSPTHFNGWPRSSSGAPGSRPIVEDLWTARELLEALFLKEGWRVPDWLALGANDSNPATCEAAIALGGAAGGGLDTGGSKPRTIGSKQTADKVLQSYLIDCQRRGISHPSIKGLEQHASDNGWRGGRDLLRGAWHTNRGVPSRGRPRKSPK